MHFNWAIDFSDILTLLTILGGIYVFLDRQTKAQLLRDQKIDMVLFGSEGRPGVVQDVEVLKHDSAHIFDALGKLGFDRRAASPDRREHQ